MIDVDLVRLLKDKQFNLVKGIDKPLIHFPEGI